MLKLHWLNLEARIYFKRPWELHKMFISCYMWLLTLVIGKPVLQTIPSLLHSYNKVTLELSCYVYVYITWSHKSLTLTSVYNVYVCPVIEACYPHQTDRLLDHLLVRVGLCLHSFKPFLEIILLISNVVVCYVYRSLSLDRLCLCSRILFVCLQSPPL